MEITSADLLEYIFYKEETGMFLKTIKEEQKPACWDDYRDSFWEDSDKYKDLQWPNQDFFKYRVEGKKEKGEETEEDEGAHKKGSGIHRRTLNLVLAFSELALKGQFCRKTTRRGRIETVDTFPPTVTSDKAVAILKHFADPDRQDDEFLEAVGGLVISADDTNHPDIQNAKAEALVDGLRRLMISAEENSYLDQEKASWGIWQAVMQGSRKVELAKERAKSAEASERAAHERSLNNVDRNSNEYDIQQDFEVAYREAVMHHDHKALFKIAMMYWYELVDSKSVDDCKYPTARACFEELAKTDSEYRPIALSKLGHMYYSQSVEDAKNSYEESYKLHRRAYELGLRYNQHIGAEHLAWRESLGIGCEFSPEDAEWHYRVAAETDSLAHINYGKWLESRARFSEAAEQFNAAKESLPGAAHALGLLHLRGVLEDDGFKPNVDKAKACFRSAVEGGKPCEPQVYHDLAHLYFRYPDRNNPQSSFKTAEEYYRIAADRGHMDSQYMLANMLEHGHSGSGIDIESAIHYYEKAAAQGHALASGSLARLYQKPSEFTDYEKACNHARDAMLAGLPFGAFRYANMLLLGRGCKPDLAEAVKQYKKALDGGLYEAELMLEIIEGINPSLTSAITHDEARHEPREDAHSKLNEQRVKAKEGDVTAKYRTATMLYYGFDRDDQGRVVRDFGSAAKLLEEVVDGNEDSKLNACANTLIGRMYYAGAYYEQSYKESFRHYKNAEEDNPYAAKEATFARKIGCGCDYDYDATEQSYLRIVEKGDDLAKEGLAQFYEIHGRFVEAEHWYREEIDPDSLSPDASYRLGLIYRNGTHVTPPNPDYYLASVYFQQAMDKGHVEAALELGILYFRPTRRFKKDFKKAKECFEFAAKAGNAEAQYMCGFMHEFGHVDKRIDLRKAINYYEKSAARGNHLSSAHLAMLYQLVDPSDNERAFFHCNRAAEYGDSNSEFMLGNMYLLGRGCKADISKAKRYYKKAIDHGFTMAEPILDLFIEDLNPGSQCETSSKPDDNSKSDMSLQLD